MELPLAAAPDGPWFEGHQLGAFLALDLRTHDDDLMSCGSGENFVDILKGKLNWVCVESRNLEKRS